VQKAVRDVISGKTFDNGVLCSSENSVVVDEAISEAVTREFLAQGAYFMSRDEADAVARVLVTPQRLPNPELVGKAATVIAHKCGISVPAETRVLIARLEGVGRDYPLSIEKLCPVLSFYVVKDWREGCERCKQILRYGGMGHTMSIHSQNDSIIQEFGLKKPAFRIVVNTPTTFGSIGLTTGLDPSMTLGCGGYGGNITSDNISPKHLLNIKRLAYEIAPFANRFERAASGTSAAAPRAAGPSRKPAGIPADLLTARIDRFLAGRGYREDAPTGARTGRDSAVAGGGTPGHTTAPSAPLDFVCEEDVRNAMRVGRTLVLAERAIVTPAARELGEQHRIFAPAPWEG
jgi:acetaldehyde dehydrogenase (acetylating)